MQRHSMIVRIIWAACLLVGGANHARILLQHGLWWDYGGVNWGSALYWSSLTVIDPLVAALLFIRPRAGIFSSVLLIVTNVAHNLWVRADYMPEAGIVAWAASHPFILSQIGFMLFVLATLGIALRGVPGPGSDSSNKTPAGEGGGSCS
jgi:hypothetical protein